jgi:hypothetical protein
MSMLSDQVSAVLTAPIPFTIALVPLGVAMWAAFEWAYRSVLNKRRELYDLSRLEVDHWKIRAEQTTKEAVRQIEALNEQLKKEQNLTAQAKTQLDQLKDATSQLTEQLKRLGQANSSATGYTGYTGYSPPTANLGLSSSKPVVTQSSSDWPPRRL